MDLSNSFLVIASINEDTKTSKDLLGIKYSSQRIEKFSTKTKFIKKGDSIICEKERNFINLSPTEEIR